MKEIKYNPDTKDYDMFLDGEYVGSAQREIDAHRRLDAMVFVILSHRR